MTTPPLLTIGPAIRSLLALAGIAATFAFAGPAVEVEPAYTGPDHFTTEQVDGWVDEVIARQIPAGCTTEPHLSETVLVRPAGTNAEGVFDTGVLTSMPFDEAWAAGEAGTHYAEAWCD